MTERTLSDQDLVEVLEDIIRNGGNVAAKIAAIKALRELGADERPSGGFDELDQLAQRRRAKS